MEHLEIVKIGLENIEDLQKIGKQTFFETFAETNSEENMQKYLEESFALEKLENELKNPNSAFYFAKNQGEILGYLKINFGGSQTELKDRKSLEIERIYVLHNYHGKKVGQKLYEKAIETAKEKGVEYVWLGVWEENHKAINFYKKNGFEEFDKHIFVLGDDEQTDIMMKLKI